MHWVDQKQTFAIEYMRLATQFVELADHVVITVVIIIIIIYIAVPIATRRLWVWVLHPDCVVEAADVMLSRAYHMKIPLLEMPQLSEKYTSSSIGSIRTPCPKSNKVYTYNNKYMK